MGQGLMDLDDYDFTGIVSKLAEEVNKVDG